MEKYIIMYHLFQYEVLGALTERTIKSRLGIRMLAEHHVGLRTQNVCITDNFIFLIIENIIHSKYSTIYIYQYSNIQRLVTVYWF